MEPVAGQRDFGTSNEIANENTIWRRRRHQRRMMAGCCVRLCAIIERTILDGLRFIYYLANGNLEENTFVRRHWRAGAWDYEENNQIVNCYVTFANKKKSTHSGWVWPTQPKKRNEKEIIRNQPKNDI